jgi:Thioredoxin domain-containing protein
MGEKINELNNKQVKYIIKIKKYSSNNKLKGLFKKCHKDLLEDLSGGGKKKKKTKNKRKKTKNKRKKTKNKRKKTKNVNKSEDCVIYFSMKGCPHCDNFNPIWEKTQEKYPGINMFNIDRENEVPLMEQLNIKSFPTIIILKG